MEIAKRTKEHTIFKKKSGRYAVQNKDGQWVKAADKVKILLDAKLIKLTPAKPKAEAPAPAADAAAPAATETPSS